MGSDWSGLCSANSLPQEVRNRFASNMMLVESAARTPGNIPVGLHRGYSRAEIQQLLSFLGDPLEKLYVLFARDGQKMG